jgi:DNA-binding response OmpR family regulator
MPESAGLVKSPLPPIPSYLIMTAIRTVRMTQSPKPSILVVDDDEEARAMLQLVLARDEYEVTTAASAEDALRKLAVLSFEVVVTDLRLPGMDGVHLLREVQRRWPDTVLLVLTAYPTLDTAVAALRAGAHDYLSKPCPPAEIRRAVEDGLDKRRGLIKRIELMRALEQQLMEGLTALREEQAGRLRRVPPKSASPAVEATHIVRVGAFLIDRERHVALLGNRQLNLTPVEFEILALLAERAPAVISPRELMRRTLNYEVNDAEAGESARWHIHHLRRKLEADGVQSRLIRTVRGLGYQIDI